MVGEQRVDQAAGALDLGQLAHPVQVRGALGVEVLARPGGPSISASTTLANSTVCRCGSGSTGSASHASTSVAPRSVMT